MNIKATTTAKIQYETIGLTDSQRSAILAIYNGKQTEVLTSVAVSGTSILANFEPESSLDPLNVETIVDFYTPLEDVSLRVGSTNNTTQVTGTGGFVQWDVVEQASTVGEISSTDPSKIVITKDMNDVLIGGKFTSTSQGPRFSPVLILVVEGVPLGELDDGYVRNAGESYDFSHKSFVTPLDLGVGDEIQVMIASREQGGYGQAGSLSGTIRGADCKLWIKP